MPEIGLEFLYVDRSDILLGNVLPTFLRRSVEESAWKGALVTRRLAGQNLYFAFAINKKSRSQFDYFHSEVIASR
jgi:hypothetical protein